MKLSIVIPALDEEAALPLLLGDLQPLRARGAEIIVVDGGSRDGTMAAAFALADSVLAAPRGRALQLNAGASRARGDLLLFLHADSRAGADTVAAIAALADAPGRWGFFGVRLRGRSKWLGVVARCMGWRSRLGGIATGDQGLFVPRALFAAVGGYPAQPLMEDIEICRRLRRRAAPLAHRVMQAVRPPQSREVAVRPHRRHRPAAVHQAVVEQCVEQPVGRDAGGRPGGEPLPGARAPGEQPDRHGREAEHEQVVEFEPSVLRLVMRAMQRPQRTVHHPAMRRPGHALHADERGEEHQQRHGDRHRRRTLAPASVPDNRRARG